MNISFSRYFPAYHPRKGEPTNFIEKIWVSLGAEFVEKQAVSIAASFTDLRKDSINDFGAMKDIQIDRINQFTPKLHTIRSGNRWKPGMKFKPVCWSGKPYNSKVIQFAPEMEVVKTYSFEHYSEGIFAGYKINGLKIGAMVKIEEVAKNDGLTVQDFLDWFQFDKSKPFSGQIICWSDKIEY